MISTINKTSVKCTAAAIIAISLLAGCSSLKAPANPQSSSLGHDNTASTALPVPTDTVKNTTSSALTPQKGEDTQQQGDKSIVYKNAQYGFSFSLPISWKGYTIMSDKWDGVPPGKSLNDSGTVSGPLISIRHPKWTSKVPRQDIPILVFTKSQWNSLQHEEFSIGAAPIGPTELGHNSRFVFALPARYNYAFPTGYEEV
ncbi:MAG TPA: peptidase, partial [Clostridia bacterium]